LKRALTPADGVPDTSASAALAARAVDTAVAQPFSVAAPPRSGSRLVVAAAMFGVAIGLEIAGVLSRPRHREMLT
jgi:hypothetical protein